MNIYISGPMTGLPDYNYPAFNEAAALMREQGHIVYNPAEYPYDGPLDQFPLRAAFHEYCGWICDRAEAILMLPGWSRSKGATAERCLALAIGVKVMGAES